MNMRTNLKKILDTLWIGIFFIFIPYIIKSRIPDSDTFFLAATGRYIVENNVIPSINPFVIHSNFGIIVQQWLFDVLIYNIYSIFGNLGLLVYVGTTFTVSMILLYKYFGLFTNNKIVKRSLLLISGFIYVNFGVARPTSISFIIFVLLLYCIEKYRRTVKIKYLIPLPFLSILQINIHSAMWPMMFVLIIPYIFPYTLPKKKNIKQNVQKWFYKNKYILLTMMVMLGTGFLNPNGLKGMTYVLNSYNSATNGLAIGELMPPSTDNIYGFVILAVIAFFAIYIYKNKNKMLDSQYDSQIEFTRFYMTCGVLILACSHIRNIWFLLIGATPIILDIFNTQNQIKEQHKETSTFRLIEINAVCIILIVFLTYFMFSISSYSVKTNKDSHYAPIEAADYLDEKNAQDIVLYTEFDNGAYMEWRGYQVYMDARPELFQTNINGQEDIYTEFCNIYNGTIDYAEFINKYKFTHLLVSKNTYFEMYLNMTQNYKAVVKGNGYTLYEIVQIQ